MPEKRTTLHALKWSTLGHILPQVVSPFIAIYIARLLCPEAFGLIAIATIVISFLQIFLATGFTTALIQKQGNQTEIYSAADFIFSFNLIMSSIFYLIILFSSSAIAQFFHNSDAKLVISILSFSLVIRAFGDVQLAMLQKNMDFKSVFFRQIVPTVSLLVVTLPLGSLGYGVWALVAGKLVSDILAAIILWWKSEWKPRFNFNFKENATQVLNVLRDFGFQELGISIDDLTSPDRIIQIGYPPLRIDLITDIDGVDFSTAWDNKDTSNYGKQKINIINRDLFIQNKSASGRQKDKEDLEKLK